jgi:hypothetical protein
MRVVYSISKKRQPSNTWFEYGTEVLHIHLWCMWKDLVNTLLVSCWLKKRNNNNAKWKMSKVMTTKQQNNKQVELPLFPFSLFSSFKYPGPLA